MWRRIDRAVSLVCLLGFAGFVLAYPTFLWAADGAPTLWPSRVELTADHSRQQLLIRAVDGTDATLHAQWTSANPAVATVDERGILRAVAPGDCVVRAEIYGKTVEATVRVKDLGGPRPIDFERDVLPILTRHGCNSGPCHGKARGQNGFQLSLLGFDSVFDLDSLLSEGRGRRVSSGSPEQSLLLLKPIGAVPHGGGVRLARDGAAYQMLLRWIQDGAPRSQPETPKLVRVSVEPTDRTMVGSGTQQLAVTAHYSDDSTRDVTDLATFQSSESGIATVDERGTVVAGPVMGEAAVMARYMGRFGIFRVAVPLSGSVPDEYYAGLPRWNFVDEHVWSGLRRLRLTASQPAAEHKFLRRVYIDVIGRLPTADETRAFLTDSTPDKRAKLVETLLQSPEYAEHWSNKWADLLRPNPYRVGIKATFNYDAWIRDAFRSGKPYDEFVRDLLTAQGSTYRNGATTLFRDRREPEEITTIVSQLFLGIRLECAKCHQHPFESYSQADYYSFAAYFSRLGRKGTGLSPPISGSEEFLFTAARGEVRHPLTSAVLPPKPLFGAAPPVSDDRDPREALAAWITSKENPYFAQTMANRVWTDLMGRGLVEPVDDLRATNPPSNAALLEALGADFRDHRFDVRHLIHTICSSYAYSVSSLPSDRNIPDTRNYSRFYRQRLRAEVLLDSVCSITGVPETFEAMPPGSLSKEIWTHRVDSLFLDSFGRPDPNQDPPCERTSDTTIVQALHLMNSEKMASKIMGDEGYPARVAKTDKTPPQIIEELYLACYNRFPTAEETAIGEQVFLKSDTNRRRAVEDLLWALFNTPEFTFKD
jgi:hypothetical protein